MSVSFDNTEQAFAYKSDKDLKNAKFLFSSMSHPLIVKLGTQITPWAIKSGLPINGIIRSTIFKQFVGGESLEETAPVTRKLAEYNVQAILDYGVEGKEGEENFEHATDVFIKVIEYAHTQPNTPFMSVKLTGIIRFALLEKLDAASNAHEAVQGIIRTDALNDQEKSEWERVEDRLKRICEAANKNNIGVLIDAEETWIQHPVDALVMKMMERFNKGKVVIYNTLQLYRHDRVQFLKDSYDQAKAKGFTLAEKLVRGAYMEKERARAAEKGYPSPINPDKASTDHAFNTAVDFCIDHVDDMYVLIGSHNEYSNLLGTQLLDKKGRNKEHPHVHFSQLFGMSDNITFNLAKEGFSVSKYLPFGPIKDVIPYLMRRAEENTSIGGQTSKELRLINAELERRQKK
jgi:proline dehydrogenase